MAKEVLVTVQPITGEAVYIEVQQDYAPVQAVNGRIGFVTLGKSDVGLSNVENLSILGASGHLQYQIDQLDTGYASQTEINILSGLLAQTGSNLNSKINNLSGYSNSTFSTITNLQSTGLNLQNQINNLSGYSNSNFYPNTNPSGFITGVNLSTYATVANLQSTGQNLQNQINNLDLNYASDLQLSQTGSNLQQQINNLYGSGFITGVDLSHLYPRSNPSGFITGVNLSSYATTASLAATGSALTAQINNLSGTLTGNYASISNLALTGINLDSKINNLSGVSVLVYGNQTIDGTKTFRNSVYIHDLYITGTEFIANVQNNFIESSYILLNLTGGATDGGIFFVTGSGATGVNDYGPIIGFDHTDKFKFGIARRSDDLSVLNDIAAVQDITNYSGFVNSNFYPRNNPSGFVTGVDLSALYPRSNPSGFIGIDLGTNGKLVVSDNSYGDELGILTDNDEVLAVKMSDGSFQYGGGFPNVKPPISVLNGNVSFYNTGGNSVYDNPFLTIDNGINKIRFGIQPQNSNAVSPLDDAGFIFDGDPGNQYILEFLNGAAGNAGGKITFNKTGYVAYQQDLSNFANGNLSVGIYNYKASTNHDSQYLNQESAINTREQTSPVSGIKNDDIVNLYFSRPNAGLTDPIDNGVNNTTYSRTLKVNPGILVDHNGAASSRNLIKFDDATQYSGKAIRKVRYNSTIGNGYERILLSADSDDVDNCPIIRPKTRRIETFYDINVPSGGGTTRYFLFRTPTSFPFAQAACMNLRFNFEADSSPCVISGLVYGTNEHVLTLSGANYSFVQKERVILISKGEGGNTAEFKHW